MPTPLPPPMRPRSIVVTALHHPRVPTQAPRHPQPRWWSKDYPQDQLSSTPPGASCRRTAPPTPTATATALPSPTPLLPPVAVAATASSGCCLGREEMAVTCLQAAACSSGRSEAVLAQSWRLTPSSTWLPHAVCCAASLNKVLLHHIGST